MAAIGLVNPVCQFLDDDGNPVSGGLLYSFLAGTSTLTPTYLASTLDSGDENTDPIELDAGGRCIIYLDPAYSYDLLLTDADGVTIWTAYDVSPAALAS